MVTLNYGETSIPADNYTVRAGGTIQVAAAFERSVALVGGMDTSNGTATEGEAVEVDDFSEAADLFGTDSELYDQVQLAYENGAVTVYAVPVDETTTTESITGSQSGTLDNAPIFNPQLHGDESITVTDDTAGTDVTVEYTYGETPPQPTDEDTVVINLITGEWAADESADYTFDYTYGDYSTAIDEAIAQEPRILGLCQEADSLTSTASGQAETVASDYNVMSVVGGGTPFTNPDSPDVQNATVSTISPRLSLLPNPYGYLDEAETDMVRAVGAVAGELASLPLGISSTNNSLTGIESMRTDLSPNEAGTLADEGFMPLLDYPPVTIVKDMTTSDDQRFERVYAMNVVDEIVTLLHDINRQYIGDQARDENIRNLRASLRSMLRGLTNSDPPLLDTLEDDQPYAIQVERSDSSDNVFDERIGVDVAGVIDTINASVVVGDVTTQVDVEGL